MMKMEYAISAIMCIVNGANSPRVIEGSVGEGIDWLNIVIGAVIGAVLGFALAELVGYWKRPKVRLLGFVAVLEARKDDGLRFRQLCMEIQVTGRHPPGLCGITIRKKSSGERVFARMPNTPLPAVDRDIPVCYFQPLFIGRVYRIPILVEDEPNRYRLFGAGWWVEPTRMPIIEGTDEVVVEITGSSLRWDKAWGVGSVIEACRSE